MKNSIIILGSTGSIGKSTMKIIDNSKSNFSIKLLTTNKNTKLLLKQALKFKVKNVIIYDDKQKLSTIKNFRKNKINVFHNISEYTKKNGNKVDFTINGISGTNGLNPTLEIIPYTKNIGIANKESLICGWHLIYKNLKKYRVKFVPLDSEHFSIFSLIQNHNISTIKTIYLTASGGPFLKKNNIFIKSAKLKDILKHPNWNMGKKITIDSASMMNKIFEVFETRNIFNVPLNKIKIIIHPKSIVHAIVEFNSGVVKFLAHKPNMEIPIYNFLFNNGTNYIQKKYEMDLFELNGLNFIIPSIKKFPYLKLININDTKNSYFDIILVAANDTYLDLLINNRINFLLMQRKLLEFMKVSKFVKFYGKSPSNINDINNMISSVRNYIQKME